jgi:hypothetical protein
MDNMSVNLSDLKEIDDFQIYKNFIKKFILEDQILQKIIYYPVRNPLLQDNFVRYSHPKKEIIVKLPYD